MRDIRIREYCRTTITPHKSDFVLNKSNKIFTAYFVECFDHRLLADIQSFSKRGQWLLPFANEYCMSLQCSSSFWNVMHVVDYSSKFWDQSEECWWSEVWQCMLSSCSNLCFFVLLLGKKQEDSSLPQSCWLAATVISFVTSASECVPVKSTDG